jgi:4,5-DOPA dioxygenase extradiol
MTHAEQATQNRDRMPVVFVGHGSPMNVIEDNPWSRGFSRLGDLIPRPDAILAISAHWYVNGSFVTANAQPPTIHDFGGFPQPLYEIEYPAPGQLELAESVCELLGADRVNLSEKWGLDHGIWSVLHWMYPAADIPVIQLSMDRRLDVRQHFEIGRTLAQLRKQNILILTSGNITHNLPDAFRQMQSGTFITPGWASRFDATVKHALQQHDNETLLSLWPGTADAQRAHPTADHWLPLIYAAGAADESDEVTFPTEGFDLGSLSMRNVVFG